jgi:serine protease
VKCPSTVPHFANNTGQFKGYWFDNTAISSTPSRADLEASARRAARHWGNSTQASNINAQYVIATPHGKNTADFTNGDDCAYHAYTASDTYGGYLSFTNLPYMPDKFGFCGMNKVNAGTAGYLDGVTLVASHEYAESVTDPFLNAWMDENGVTGEIGDKCSWVDYAQNMTFYVNGAAMNFPVSSNCSNATGGCTWWSY